MLTQNNKITTYDIIRDVETMDGEMPMPQPEVSGAPVEFRRRSLVGLIVVAIVLIVAIVWIGSWATDQQNQSSARPTSLTEAQKAEILKSLQLPPGTPPLSESQKADILKSLQLPPNTPPLTDAQKAEILKSLK